MWVSGINIPDKPLSNFELGRYAKQLEIPNFRGVFMRDTLPEYLRNTECGIINFNTHDQPGCHWVGYYKQGRNRIYFDSFGQITPSGIQRYLKTGSEFQRGQQATNQQIFCIERVLRRQRQRAYVKWRCYSNAFNSWVPLQDVV